ncbi:MAG: TonB-dependent receptor, partial [Blastocatellia bacterium]|nr:TonB-dependent receptor [Blastocatellia bacterium]
MAIITVILLITVGSSAQVTKGELQGIVFDPNKALVQGAKVTITNVATGQARETVTNTQGFYRVTNLEPGINYKIEVSAAGFAGKTVNDVRVMLAAANDVDIVLGLASTQEVVQVNGEAVLLDTSSSELSTQYTVQQLTQLPYNGGAIDNLALLTPGVLSPGDSSFSNGVGISANGNRGRSNSFQIDGQDNNDNSVAGPALTLTNTEAVGAFQVVTNAFSAEFGRNSGAQINVVTKSGTNQFHGSVFEYLANSALNSPDNLDKRSQANYNFLASNGFSDFSGLARRSKDPFTSNRFGGAIGGPIKSNKAFFFVTYQGDRQRGESTINNLGSGQVTFTPQSAALAAQLFPNAATQALTSTAIGGGPAFVKGVGQLLIAPPLTDTNGDGKADAFVYGPNNPFGLTPTPNMLSDGLYVNVNGVPTPLYFGEAARLVRNDVSEDQVITRLDYNITDKDILSGRYIYDNSRFPLATGSFVAGAIFDVPSNNNNLGLTYTRTISSRIVNEARFNFSRLNVRFGDPNANPLPGPGIQFGGVRDLNSDGSLSFGTPNTLPQSRKVDVYQFQDTITATLGTHGLKFGPDIRLQKVQNFFLPNFLGVDVFNSGGTIPAGSSFVLPDGTPRDGSTATAFENFLLGRPRDIRFALGSALFNTTQNDYFFFLQDDWRVKPTLTLHLGARYEVSTQPLNPLIDQINAREANPSTAIFNPAFDLSTRTATKIPTDSNNISPRIGFAWSPNINKFGSRFSNGKFVLRGGFGIAYDPSFFNIVLNTVTAAPYAAAGIVRQTPGGPGAVSFPFLPNSPSQLTGTPGTNGGDPRLFSQTGVDPNFRNP